MKEDHRIIEYTQLLQLRKVSLNFFFHSAVHIYDFHILIISIWDTFSVLHKCNYKLRIFEMKSIIES